MSQDLRTQALVLRRTNYGETDRILNLLTPEGKKSVLAKAARKEKSKLAGGIELFCLSEVTIHAGKGDLAILTSAKMLCFYQRILADLEKLTFASNALKRLNRAAEHVSSPEYFSIAAQVFSSLDNETSNLSMIESWFQLNLARVGGDTINLIYDHSGAKLKSDQTYFWDSFEKVLSPHPEGNITADHIKLMRLIITAPLATVEQVINVHQLTPAILPIAQTFH